MQHNTSVGTISGTVVSNRNNISLNGKSTIRRSGRSMWTRGERGYRLGERLVMRRGGLGIVMKSVEGLRVMENTCRRLRNCRDFFDNHSWWISSANLRMES